MTTMVCACCYKELLLSGVLLFLRLCLFIFLQPVSLFCSIMTVEKVTSDIAAQSETPSNGQCLVHVLPQ